MTENTFTESDRQRFATLKSEIRQLLQRNLPDSEAIYECGLRFLEIRDRKYHHMDDEEDFDEWADGAFDVGQHQARKYYNIGTRLTREECTGKHQGVDVMNQISLAPVTSRPVMWKASEKERLSSGALSAGRKAALRHVRTKQYDRADRELLKVARRRNEQELEERERRKLEPPSPAESIQRPLGQATGRIEAFLTKGHKMKAAEVAAIHVQIARLGELGRELAKQEGGPEDPAARTFEKSELAKGQGSQVVADPGPEPPAAPAMKKGVPLSRAVFLPVAAAIGGKLGPEKGAEVREMLSRIVRGDRPRRVVPALRAALGDFLSGAGPEAELLEQGLQRLEAPDWRERGSFALEWMVGARLPGCEQKLKVLSLLEMPDELKALVIEWRDKVCGRTVPAPVTAAEPAAAAPG